VRLFGGVIPLEKKKKSIGKDKEKEKEEGDDEEKKEKNSITFTGPVQFKMGRSLHPVELKHIKGTGAFAATAGKEQKTFREEYVLPYSFICFYGIINENAAKHTKLTDDDIKLLMEGLWEGTKNLISRTKVGQMPRLLLKVDYKEPGFFTGDLDSFLKIKSESLDKIRGVDDFKLDLSDLINAIGFTKDKIETVWYKIDPFLKTNPEIPKDWKKLAD